MSKSITTSCVATSSANQSLTRHTAYYFVGRIATGLVGLLTLVAFTRVLDPEDYGRYSVVIAIVGFISGVGFQWLRQCLVRFGTGVSGTRQPLLGTLGVLLFCLLLIVALAGVIIPVVASKGWTNFTVSLSESATICILVATQAWFELTADASRTEFRPWRYSIATLIRAISSLVLGVMAALWLQSVWAVLLAMAAAYGLASAFAAPRWLFGVLLVHQANVVEARKLAAYGLPLASTLGLTFILDSADRLMLASMAGYAEAGVYSSAYNLAQFSIGTVLIGLGLGSFPLAVDASNESNKVRTEELLRSNLTLSLAIGLPAIVGLVMLAPSLDHLLLGNYVAGKSDMVTMIVAVAIGLAAIRSYCVDVVFMLYQRTWLQTIVIGSSAVLNVGLNWVWIPLWGSIGAALATLAAFLYAFVGSWWLSQRYLRITISIRDLGKISFASAVMVAVIAVLPPSTGSWIGLTATIFCGLLTYIILMLALNAAGSRLRLQIFFRTRFRSE